MKNISIVDIGATVIAILISSIAALTTTPTGAHAFTCMGQACLVPLCLLANHTGINCNAILHDNATLHDYCQEVTGSNCPPQLLKVLTNMSNTNKTTANANSPEFNQGYRTGINEWNQFNSVSHNFECPLAKTAPHSDFCKGYDAALMFENSDQ